MFRKIRFFLEEKTRRKREGGESRAVRRPFSCERPASSRPGDGRRSGGGGKIPLDKPAFYIDSVYMSYLIDFKSRGAVRAEKGLCRRFVQAALLAAGAALILSACSGKDPGAESVSGKTLECFRHGGSFKVGFSNQAGGADANQDSSNQDLSKTSQAEEVTFFNESHPDKESCEAKIHEMKKDRPDIR